MPDDFAPDDYRPPEPPERWELEELAEMLERVGKSDEQIKKYVKMAAMNPSFFHQLKAMYYVSDSETVTEDPFIPYDAYPGNFRLGTNPDGEPVGLTREELNEHMMVVGRSGAGKTTFFYNVMDLCVGEQVPYMVFDFKSDFRHLARHRDLLVLNWRDLKINPLEPPPGVQVGKWAEVLADTISHSLGFLQGSESYLLNKLYGLYDKYDTDHEEYPSLFELREFVKADPIPMMSPRFNYKERMVNRLTMATGFSGRVFDCSTGQPIEELLDRNVVFELKEPNQYVTNLVTELIVTWIFYYRDAQGQRGRLRHAIMFDEAKRVFDTNRNQDASSFPPIDVLTAQVREFGESLIVADQEPSKLSDSIKANTNGKLWMSLAAGHDIEEMQQTFGLDEERTDFTRTLAKGEAVFKTADRKPVPVDLPDYQLEKSMTEDEIREMMAPELEALQWEERVRPKRFLEAVGKWDEAQEQEKKDPSETGLDETAEALLASAVETPFLKMRDRYEVLDIDSRQGTALKNELSDRGLVKEVTVNNRKPGANPTFLELTEQGRAVLEDRGYDVSHEGRGGFVHRFWQDQIQTFYAGQGYDAIIEYAVPEGAIDVYAEGQDETVGVEVARSPEHELENVRKCLDADVDTVQVAYLDEDVREKIEAALEVEFGRVPEAVEFVSVSAFS